MTKKYTISHKDKLTNEIASYFEKNCSEINVAYLFGSFLSKGPFADLDIGLLVDSVHHDFLTYEFNLEHALEQIVKFPVDIRVLNCAPLSFCYNVIKSKYVLLERDPNLRADFESRILRQYFDFRPFQKRYLTEVINAPI